MLSDDELGLVWFSYQGYSFSKVEKILEYFNKIEAIFDKNSVKNAIFKFECEEEVKQSLMEIDHDKFLEQVQDEFYKYGIEAVTYVSNGYPEKLKNIADPPLVLFAKGDLSLLSKKSISIVGTRKPTSYGKLVCEKFVRELVDAGLVTVSGLAYGIDTVVAESTLKFGGKTIAVLGGGLDSIYPFQNKGLAKQIEASGLLVSEYRIGQRPANYSFVQRNRIVAALGLGTLIVEAGAHSGTMTTANYAIEQGRELFVVPGNIYSPQSEGTNNLINEIPDSFTISPEQILTRLKINKKTEERKAVQVDMDEQKILDNLSTDPQDFDSLSELTGLSAAALSSKLIKLEMMDLVKKCEGNTYIKV